MNNFRRFAVAGLEADRRRIGELVGRSLMLVTALAPVIGYDKAAEIAHHAQAHDLTLKEAALDLDYVTAEEFDRVVVPSRMTGSYVARE